MLLNKLVIVSLVLTKLSYTVFYIELSIGFYGMFYNDSI